MTSTECRDRIVDLGTEGDPSDPSMTYVCTLPKGHPGSIHEHREDEYVFARWITKGNERRFVIDPFDITEDTTPAVFRACVCGAGPKWTCERCNARHECEPREGGTANVDGCVPTRCEHDMQVQWRAGCERGFQEGWETLQAGIAEALTSIDEYEDSTTFDAVKKIRALMSERALGACTNDAKLEALRQVKAWQRHFADRFPSDFVWQELDAILSDFDLNSAKTEDKS